MQMNNLIGVKITMEKKSLYDLRKKLLLNKEKLIELNNKYNEFLNNKYSGLLKQDNKNPDERKIKVVSHILLVIFCFDLVILFLAFSLPIISLLFFMFLLAYVSEWLEKTFLPPLFENSKKSRKRREKDDEKSEEQTLLYDEVYEARRVYHELYKEYEGILNKLTNEELNAYLEYLKEVDSYIELLEAESTRENATLNEVKQKEKQLEI